MRHWNIRIGYRNGKEARDKFWWEKDDERLRRFMNISPYEKMRRLQQFNEFIYKASNKKTLAIRRRLRENRS